ncbi:hypothetical protein Dimus_028394 [Dionaea muscipula]
MGIMSRRVVPVCGNLCCFCPSLRARSRQPVKRYKTLLADIFPRSQDAGPNDRKIAKLCEYASKNPLRIPKITENLEHRFYKDLRNERIGSVKVVLSVYRKLLSSCKEQMPLFATSLLGIIQTLLDQTRETEIQVLGCHVLVDFINCQEDTTYMVNLEKLTPKLCQLTQEVGNDDRALCLRAAGLQALAPLVSFMGKHSHILVDFDKIIAVTLENYMELEAKSHECKLNGKPFQTEYISMQGAPEAGNHGSSFSDSNKFSRNLSKIKQELQVSVDTSKSPSYWSSVCLYNMVGLAKEATTIRRVLEPFFQVFDSEDYWSSENGLACSVLMYLQSTLEKTGENSHFLLSMLTKHLDNKNVVKQPQKKINIINVTTQLAKTANQQVSVALTGALLDLVKHLRKCMQYSAEASSPGGAVDQLNAGLQSAIEECISQLSNKIGDMGPILDMMAVVLDSLPCSSTVTRTTMYSLCRLTQIISSLPNMSYHKKVFPDALFHQLLLAMAHADSETRTGAHYVFSLVIMPSVICPRFHLTEPELTSFNGLGFSSIVPLQKARSSGLLIHDETQDKLEATATLALNHNVDNAKKESTAYQPLTESCNLKIDMINRMKDLASLRLSSNQINLLLSSIWDQATHTENSVANFVAIAHTYSIALCFARSKSSDHLALVRCFQLAFSLRSISLDEERPFHRRSLFTLASFMLMFTARAANLPELIPIFKSSLTESTVDPHLKMLEDIRLQVIDMESYTDMNVNGSDFTKLDEHQLKEIVLSHLMSKFENLSEDELSGIRKRLLQGFSPDDSYPLRVQMFMETPKPGSPPVQVVSDTLPNPPLLDEAAFPEDTGNQSGGEMPLSIDILSVNELLDSVLETARQVTTLPVSITPMPYDQVKNQCEALVTDKQRKMSVLHSVKQQQQEAKAVIVTREDAEKIPALPIMVMDDDSEEDPKPLNREPIRGCNQARSCSVKYGLQNSFRLPPASPYDKFLKAAGS